MMDKTLREHYEQTVNTSATDALTGLANHGFFQALLSDCLTQARNRPELQPVCLCLFNLDDFTLYNRTKGPLQADMALRATAEAIACASRESAIPARFGGDVFALLMPATSAEQARGAAWDIQKDMEVRFHGSLTVSAGISVFPGDADNKKMFIEKATNALCSAKLYGKNRVEICRKSEEDILSPGEYPVVLVVDDIEENIELLGAMLRPMGYHIIEASSGEEALSWVRRGGVDLVLLDIVMPGMDGFELCGIIKENDSTRMIPVVMITGLSDTESKVKSLDAGADDFLSKPLNRLELIARTKSLIRSKRLNDKLVNTENVLYAFAHAVESKDAYTEGHIQRVAGLAVSLGEKMDLGSHKLDALHLGGVLHDIGKIGIPNHVLNKPGKLSCEEWDIMKGHPCAGYRIALPLQSTLGDAVDIIRHHHEKLDGSGYPDGLSGDEIPLTTRIVTVVDTYDALTTDRPYRKGMDRQKAIDILLTEAEQGKVDTAIVNHLIEIIGGVSGKCTGALGPDSD